MANIKYDPKYHPVLIRFICRSGGTNESICRELGINVSTLKNWKRRYVEVKEAMEEGKTFIDALVEESLLKSALGYRTKKVKVETFANGDRKITEEELDVAPNPTSIIYWLKNRQPEKWRESNTAPKEKNNKLKEISEAIEKAKQSLEEEERNNGD